MSNWLNNPVFKFSHIAEASLPEFVIDGHYYTSPNQQDEPPTIPSVIPYCYQTMPAHPNYVDAFGHFTTTHTSRFHDAMTSGFQPPPRWSPLSKTFRSLGKPWLSDHQCPSCFISLGSPQHLRHLFSSTQILPSMPFRTTLTRGKLTWLQKAPHQHQNTSNHHIKRRQCLTKTPWNHHHQNLLPELMVKNLWQRRRGNSIICLCVN